MAEVCLRPWRLSDAADVAVTADDPYLRPWSSMADLDTWIGNQIAQARGPTRAICLPDDDRALGRVALRLPEFASDAVRCAAVRPDERPAGELSYWLVPEARGRGLATAAVRAMVDSLAGDAELRSVVLDIETGNTPSERLAERLGAERRAPARIERDRFGAPRTMVVHVLRLPGCSPQRTG